MSGTGDPSPDISGYMCGSYCSQHIQHVIRVAPPHLYRPRVNVNTANLESRRTLLYLRTSQGCINLLRCPSLFLSVSVSVCQFVCLLCVCGGGLCLLVHQAGGDASVVRVQWTVVCAGSRPPSVGSYLGPAPFHRSPSS